METGIKLFIPIFCFRRNTRRHRRGIKDEEEDERRQDQRKNFEEEKENFCFVHGIDGRMEITESECFFYIPLSHTHFLFNNQANTVFALCFIFTIVYMYRKTFERFSYLLRDAQ